MNNKKDNPQSATEQSATERSRSLPKGDGLSLPKSWEIKKLGEVLSIERGGSPRPISKYITNSEDGLNWIKIADATASDKYIY